MDRGGQGRDAGYGSWEVAETKPLSLGQAIPKMCRPAAERPTLSAQAGAKQTATETSTRAAGAAHAAHDGAAAVGARGA
jgi:hypothetical protein